MSDLLMFLMNEATTGSADTAEPVDSTKDDSNKDIATNKEDVSKDSTDVENDSTEESDNAENADNGSGTEESPDTETDQETPAVAGDNDPDQAQLDDAKNKDKKLLLYRSLKELKMTFSNLSEVYEDLLRADIPSESLEAVKLVKQKVDFNVEKLDELLTNPDIATTRTVADLTLLYNIYFGDMKTVDANLKMFIKTSKVLETASKRSKS